MLLWTRQGWLKREHRGVYLVGPKPPTRAGIFGSALLAMGSGAALSFTAAAAHWEVRRGAARTEVTVPATTGRGHRTTVVVHRAALPAAHVTTYKGLRVTTLARTHLDLAGVLSAGQLAAMFEQAQVKHHFDPQTLAVEVACRSGYRGTPALRAMLADAVDATAVRSVLELRFLRLCGAHGLPRPVVNEPFGPWIPDFLWPDARLVVETDGWNFHRTAAQRRRDAERDAWLAQRGFLVLRFSWRDVTENPTRTAETIRRALAL